VNDAPRFFVERVQRGDEGFWAELTGEEAHHALRVLRLRPGDRVVLLDDTGFEYAGSVTEIDRRNGGAALRVRGSSIRPSSGEPKIHVTLIQALAKGEKMDLVIQKGTEVGVSCFLPVLSERVVIDCSPDKLGRRRERWERIAQEAAKQARRGRRPKVEEVGSLVQAVSDSAREGPVLVLWEGAEKPIKSVLKELATSFVERIALVVGPEGGFSEREARQMEDLGGRLVSLGPRILRTETAGPVAGALVLYELEAAGV